MFETVVYYNEYKGRACSSVPFDNGVCLFRIIIWVTRQCVKGWPISNLKL